METSKWIICVVTRSGSWSYYTVILLSKLQIWVIILGALVTPNWLIQSHPIEKERWSPYQICHTVLYVKSLLFSHPGTVFILCVGEHRWSGKFLQSWNCEGQTVH
jgi:hypothetical protein